MNEIHQSTSLPFSKVEDRFSSGFVVILFFPVDYNTLGISSNGKSCLV